MISLYVMENDHYGMYGIRHFLEKTGISVQVNRPSSSGIVITYGTDTKGKYSIKIEKNEIQDRICGRLAVNNEKILLCETPHNTGSGEDIHARFEPVGRSSFACVTRYSSGITIGIDIFRETGYLLTGHLDRIRETLAPEDRRELAAKPVVDALEELLFEAILNACRFLDIPLVQKSYFPDDRSFAVCLTHDVDELKKTYQYFTRSALSLAKGDFHGLNVQVHSLFQKLKGTEPYWTYDDIAAAEKMFGARSTYFILKESGNARLFSRKTWSVYGRNRSFQGPEMQALVRKLKANGDEIGIHGSYFSYENPKLLTEETRELELICDETIIGTRQHHLNLTVPATWKYQIQAGLHYDSSLGFRDEIGFRWGSSFPFYPLNGEERLPLLEIPLIIMDNCLDGYPDKSGAGLAVAREVRRYHGVLTLLWHPRMFISPEYPDGREVYITINQYCLDNGAWFARGRDIYQWLTLRNRQDFSCDVADSQCTIIPSDPDQKYFFTVYLPPYKKGILLSENAEIIGQAENYICIKSKDLLPHTKIIVGIT
jgi:hypothetical protein